MVRLSALIALLVISSPGLAQAPQRKSAEPGIRAGRALDPPQSSYRFPNATFHYDVEWRLFGAGNATIQIAPSGANQHVQAGGDALGVVELLFHVADRFESYLNSHTGCSASVNKHTEEGRRRVEVHIVFDYARGKAILDQKNLRNGDTKHLESDIPNCVTDMVSGIFYVASQPLNPGATVTFPLNDGGKTVEVRATVEQREDVKVPAGTYHTIRVQPEAPAGAIKEHGRMWVWYTDDPQHLPVQMRARMFWGTLTLRLEQIERH